MTSYIGIVFFLQTVYTFHTYKIRDGCPVTTVPLWLKTRYFNETLRHFPAFPDKPKTDLFLSLIKGGFVSKLNRDISNMLS